MALPDLGVAAVKAKVDTGARSSSLHAFDVVAFERAGVPTVRFEVHPVQRDGHTTVSVEAELLEYRDVRNPGGRSERRPVIRTSVRMGGQVWPIDLTLTRRDSMGFRMLVGREAVRGRFVVDPGRSYLTGGRPTRRTRKAP